MKKLLIVILAFFAYLSNAQTFLAEDNDSSVKTEYHDDLLWAYQQIDDYVVGMTAYKEKDDYGKYYQIVIFIKNLSNASILFIPDSVTATLMDKGGKDNEMKVYSYERYMKRVKRHQAWSMALTGFALGMNAGMAGYQTTTSTAYTYGGAPYLQTQTTYNYAAASAANMAATSELMMLSQMMDDKRKTKSEGYLRKNTIHHDEGLLGYMNIKYKKGKKLKVNIPIGSHTFSFVWDVSKKKD